MTDEEMTRSIEDREIHGISDGEWKLVDEVWQSHLEGSKPRTACDGSGMDREFPRNPCLPCDGEGWEVA